MHKVDAHVEAVTPIESEELKYLQFVLEIYLKITGNDGYFQQTASILKAL